VTTTAVKASPWTTYKRLLGYTRPYTGVAALAILGMIADAGALVLFTGLIRPLLDDIFVKKDHHAIFWMPIWIIIIFGARGLASFATDYGTAYIARNVVQTIRTQVFDTYLRMTSAFFANEPSGHQVARITYTSEQVATVSTDAVKVAIIDGLSVVGYAVVMIYQSPYLALALLLLVPSVGMVATVVSRRYRKISRRIQTMMGSVNGTVEETIGGQREVKIYGGQAYESKRFFDIANLTRRLNLKVASTGALSTAVIQTFAGLALALIVFLATREAVLKDMTAGTFFSVLSAMGAMLPSLKRLTSVQSNIQRGLVAAEDLFEIIDTPPEEDKGSLVAERIRGDLRFEHTEMIYPKAQAPALHGIELHCAPGTVTALVGRSGSGKSSLVSLLPRFYEPSAGAILLDGHPLTDYTLPSLRKQIAWVGQHVILFDDTVARNIAYGELEGATEAEIIAAAEAANAMEFIRRMPDGLNSRIGQSGGQLSGGQRQRLAIARAILKNAPILVLDEATSALDTESERLIQDALQRLMRDRTTLVIAHRLSTIEHADQIAVLDHGKIAELGTHTELLALGGRYAALHKMQFHDQTHQR
jgi:ATP-binding cassette, subfamily B, bacterial MsbA